MSEYQYYGFMAIDRPLSREQIAELRKLTSRATITPTQLVNEYNYGNFRGDPYQLIERYFDLHVYVTNWGTHQLLLGFPRAALDEAALAPYLDEEVVRLHRRGERLVLELIDQPEDGGGDWVEGDEGDHWLAALLPLRAELAAGDNRALYLGWLAGVERRSYEDDAEYADAEAAEGDENGELEPAVPPGLGDLTAAQLGLVDFLSINTDLVAVAAEQSASRASVQPDPAALASWIGALTPSAKDTLLLRLARGESHLQGELLRRFRADTPASALPIQLAERRTASQLRAAAAARAAVRKRAEAERAAKEAARVAEERRQAREAHLDRLAGQEERLWRQVETLVDMKRPRDYDEAVTLLIDLRDLAERTEQRPTFERRLAELRARHTRKPSLLERMDRARLH